MMQKANNCNASFLFQISVIKFNFIQQKKIKKLIKIKK
jgi:hypothetical protein